MRDTHTHSHGSLQSGVRDSSAHSPPQGCPARSMASVGRGSKLLGKGQAAAAELTRVHPSTTRTPRQCGSPQSLGVECVSCGPDQGLLLVHFSAHPEPLLSLKPPVASNKKCPTRRQAKVDKPLGLTLAAVTAFGQFGKARHAGVLLSSNSSHGFTASNLGRGVSENRHSTDVDYPPPPPYTSILCASVRAFTLKVSHAPMSVE